MALCSWWANGSGAAASPGGRSRATRTAAGDRRLDTLEAREALAVGIAQVLALLPGISRSGVTMVAGLVRGLDHAPTSPRGPSARLADFMGPGSLSAGRAHHQCDACRQVLKRARSRDAVRRSRQS
jgi:Bacitracin resistance protein BacA